MFLNFIYYSLVCAHHGISVAVRGQFMDNLYLTTMKTQFIRLCFYPLTHLSPVPHVVTFVITVSKIKYHRTYFHNPVNKYLLRSFPYEFLSPLATQNFRCLFYSKILHLLHSVCQVFFPTPHRNYLSLRHIKLLYSSCWTTY